MSLPPQTADHHEDRASTTPPATPDLAPVETPEAAPDEPAPRSVPPVTAFPSRADKTVGIGTLINNNYEITAVLKSGGMGEVYRGIEIGTGDPVAIKAILPELAEDEKVGLLFKREAKTLRQLADEAIVRYYNYVHDMQLDRYFMVMEFISGVPLSDFVQQNGPITTEAAKILLRRLSRGLSKAHARDVIHRDLSPDNVMLPDGLVGEAVLIDFGIAKSNVVKESTMAGQFAGKFKYVAPEQLGHYDGRIGPWTDMYGLALLICAAVIGTPLNMGSSIVEAVDSRRSIPDISAAPADLQPLLAHMLEPNPDDRPASMLAIEQMVDAPEMVPVKYGGQGLDAPFSQATNTPRAITTPGNIPAFGNQSQIPGLTTTGTGSLPTQGFRTAPPQPMVVEQEPEKGGSRILLGLVALFVVILGGVGFYAYSSGLLGPTATAPGRGGETAEETASQGGIPAPDVMSREGFLADRVEAECAFATRISSGQNAGMIASFSTTDGAFGGLTDAYETAFGARPELLPRDISADQCAVLDFAKALQGRGRPEVTQVFNTDTLISGETVTGQISVPDGSTVWTALISSFGGVYNLTSRLTAPVGSQRNISFGLNLNDGAEPQPQLVLTVASDSPLASAAAARDGTPASAVLPTLLEEIATMDGAASVALSYLRLMPPQ